MYFCFWLCWVFAAVQGFFLWLQCMGFVLQWLPLLRSTGSRVLTFCSYYAWTQQLRLLGCRAADSVVVAHRLSCSTTCGTFPGKGSNRCLLHSEAHSSSWATSDALNCPWLLPKTGVCVCVYVIVVPFFVLFWIQDPVRSHIWLICLFLLLKSNIALHPPSSLPTHTLENFFFKDVNFFEEPNLVCLRG